jgi:outer membrane lipoprotein-sorting protein
MVLLSVNAHADTPVDEGHKILMNVDKNLSSGQAFRVRAELVEYRSGHPQDKVVLDIYAKPDGKAGQIRNLAKYLDPSRDRNKLFLMDGSVMWFYDPASSASIRISPQQRLLGQASNGDVLSVNYAHDYIATLIGDEEITDADKQRVQTWKLELLRKEPGATYYKIDYWIQKDTFRIIKGVMYSDSGRVLKDIYYRDFQPVLGGTRPSEALIVDEIDQSLVTKIDFSEFEQVDVPDFWFQRDFLPRFGQR